jgi:hypothetical protein
MAALTQFMSSTASVSKFSINVGLQTETTLMTSAFSSYACLKELKLMGLERAGPETFHSIVEGLTNSSSLEFLLLGEASTILDDVGFWIDLTLLLCSAEQLSNLQLYCFDFRTATLVENLIGCLDNKMKLAGLFLEDCSFSQEAAQSLETFMQTDTDGCELASLQFLGRTSIPGRCQAEMLMGQPGGGLQGSWRRSVGYFLCEFSFAGNSDNCIEFLQCWSANAHRIRTPSLRIDAKMGHRDLNALSECLGAIASVYSLSILNVQEPATCCPFILRMLRDDENISEFHLGLDRPILDETQTRMAKAFCKRNKFLRLLLYGNESARPLKQLYPTLFHVAKQARNTSHKHLFGMLLLLGKDAGPAVVETELGRSNVTTV